MRVLQELGGITFRSVDHEVGECHFATSRSLGVLLRACPARFRTCDSDSPDQSDFQHNTSQILPADTPDSLVVSQTAIVSERTCHRPRSVVAMVCPFTSVIEEVNKRVIRSMGMTTQVESIL